MNNFKTPSSMVRVITVICLTILLSVIIITTGFAQSGRWSFPVRLSRSTGSAWFPDVAVDPYGQVHAVWGTTVQSSDGNPFDTVMYRSKIGSSLWTGWLDIASKRMVDDESYASRPSLEISPDGMIHLTYRNADGVQYTHAKRPVIESAKDWIQSIRIAPYGYFSSVVATPNGILHLVYTANKPTESCPICFHVFYRLSDNQGRSWSVPKDISKLPTGAAKPQLALDSKGNRHVVWESGEGGDLGQLSGPAEIFYTRNQSIDNQWEAPVRLSPFGVRANNPALIVGPDDQLLLVWLAFTTGNINYQISTNEGQSWTTPEPIPGVIGKTLTTLDGFSMALDSSGRSHLIVVGDLTEAESNPQFRRVIHLIWDGEAWLEPDVIAGYSGDLPEWPQIAIGLGNELHAIWFVRDEEHIWDSDQGEYRIMYSRGSSDARRISPQPTPTKQSEETLVQTSPTEENFNTVEPDNQPEVPDLTSEKLILSRESDFIFLIVGSVIPSLAFLILAVIVLRSKRR